MRPARRWARSARPSAWPRWRRAPRTPAWSSRRRASSRCSACSISRRRRGRTAARRCAPWRERDGAVRRAGQVCGRVCAGFGVRCRRAAAHLRELTAVQCGSLPLLGLTRVARVRRPWTARQRTRRWTRRRPRRRARPWRPCARRCWTRPRLCSNATARCSACAMRAGAARWTRWAPRLLGAARCSSTRSPTCSGRCRMRAPSRRCGVRPAAALRAARRAPPAAQGGAVVAGAGRGVCGLAGVSVPSA